jgi:hypothetical protein
MQSRVLAVIRALTRTRDPDSSVQPKRDSGLSERLL